MDDKIDTLLKLRKPKCSTDVSEFFGGKDIDDMFALLTDEEAFELAKKLEDE